MNKARAVFLDRDGVINAAVVRDGKPHPPWQVDDFNLLPGVAEACESLRSAGYKLVVVTNQPDVGRGIIPQKTVEDMHRLMCAQLPIDRVEVCYDSGKGSSSEFRKPRPGMLLHAAAELQLDLSRSFMIGDRWRDIDCGYSAGCATIFIDRGYDESLQQQPDYRVADLPSAAKLIISLQGESLP